jgi:hypothetical protein
LYNPDGTLKPPHQWDDDTAAAVAGVETEERTASLAVAGNAMKAVPVSTKRVKLWDNAKAVAMAMEHLGLNQKLTLETVLSVLPADVAQLIRQAIAAVASPDARAGGPTANAGGASGSPSHVPNS